MYIELKSGNNDRGPARIGRVTFNRTGKTLRYKGKAFQSCGGQGIGANYFDVESGEQYWISGVKKNQQDRHWAGGGPVEIDEDIREEYFELIGKK